MRDLGEAVAGLSRILLGEGSLEAVMHRITELAVVAVPACAAASITRIDNRKLVTGAATNPVAEQLGRFEIDTGEGPGLDAIRLGTPQRIASLGDECRWPNYVVLAAGAGMCSSYSLPLRSENGSGAALNLYSSSVPFLEADEKLSDLFAEQAAVTLANAEAYQATRDLIENLNIALESRDVIGQAKGIIMERERCTADRAFEILRSVSQARNIKLRELAERVVETGTWTDFDA